MGDQQLPTWNGSPLARGPFWLMVKEQLPQEDKKLKFFLRHRALINSKSQIVVMSQEHYVIINSALDPTEYGWDDPAPADPVSRLTALAAGGNATAAANLARLTTIVAALDKDDEQKKNFVIGTITINEYDRELSDTICSLIKSKTDKEDWEKTKMGLELIRKQNVDSLRAAGNTANAITIQMQNMFDDGLPEEDIASLNEYIDAYEKLNDSKEIPYPEAVLATHYGQLMINVGGATEIDFKMKMMALSAEGDRNLTLSAAKYALGEAEARQAKNRKKDGRSRKAKEDPDKDKKRGVRRSEARGNKPVVEYDAEGNKKWTPSLGPCRHCGKLGHLNKDCKEKGTVSNSTNSTATDGRSRHVRGIDPDVDAEQLAEQVFNMSATYSIDQFNSPEELLCALVSPDEDGGAKALMGRVQEDSDGESSYNPTSEDDDDHEHPAKALKSVEEGDGSLEQGEPRVREPRSPRRRFYVLPSGENKGIYYGSWNLPENIRSLAEGVSADPGKPMSRAVDAFLGSIKVCESLGIPATFRGPSLELVQSALTDGDPPITAIGEIFHSSPFQDM